MFVGDGYNLFEIFRAKIVGRFGAHIQLLNPKIDRIGTSLNGTHQGFVGSHGSHDFNIVACHHIKLTSLVIVGHNLQNCFSGNGISVIGRSFVTDELTGLIIVHLKVVAMDKSKSIGKIVE